MSFASPIWLIALVPWLAVALWLFQGRRPRALVPFLPLWQSRTPAHQPKRKLQVLPFSVLMALLAAFFSIVASARPSIKKSRGGNELHATLIIDRGLTMSAQRSGEPRFARAVRMLVDAIPANQRSGRVEVVMVPGEDPIQAALIDCAGVIARMPPTARDTSLLLSESVSAQLAATSGPVFVITDKLLRPRDRVIEIPPDGVLHDVGISLLAARERPAAQVMVQVRNQSTLREAELIVSSDGQPLHQSITLPDPGRMRDYFFNPPHLGTVISAELVAQDELPANNRSWLVREGNSPQIEPRAALEPALQRMIEAYQRSRPAADDSLRLVVVADAAQLPASAPAVLMQRSQGIEGSGAIQVVAHPVTGYVAWEHLPTPIDVAADPPVGWTPIVSIGGRTIIAVRPGSPRQVWVGFDAPSWSNTADYVVFWTNVFDWAGGGGERFVSHPLSDWTPQWKPTDPAIPEAGMWPGIYHRSDGALRAFDAPDAVIPSPARTDWRDQLRLLRASGNRLDLADALLVAAAACIVVAALFWRRPRATTLPLP